MKPKLFNLKVDESGIGLILSGLGKLPLERCFALFMNLRDQVRAEQAKTVADPEEPEEPKV